jgi:hypothetical protein
VRRRCAYRCTVVVFHHALVYIDQGGLAVDDLEAGLWLLLKFFVCLCVVFVVAAINLGIAWLMWFVAIATSNPDNPSVSLLWRYFWCLLGIEIGVICIGAIINCIQRRAFFNGIR